MHGVQDTYPYHPDRVLKELNLELDTAKYVTTVSLHLVYSSCDLVGFICGILPPKLFCFVVVKFILIRSRFI